MTVQEEVLGMAKWCEEQGWRVFPVVGKAPVPGLRWKDEKATLAQWMEATGLALIVTPPIAVVDIDRHASGCAKGTSCPCMLPDDVARLVGGSTASVRTPSGGLHLYFSDPEGLVRCSTRLIHPQIDTKGQGKGYVLIPPSRHPNGGTYAWEAMIGEDDLPPVPKAVIEALTHASLASKDYDKIFKQGTDTGNRNAAAAGLAGVAWHLLAPTMAQVTEENLLIVTDLLLFWDRRNNPPLGMKTCQTTASSVGRTHYARLKDAFERE